MREEAVRKFMWQLGCTEINENGPWMNARCPLAAWQHSGGVDSNPSFGVTVSDDERSIWYCFGCSQEPKPISWLLHNLFVLTGRYPFAAARTYREHENHWAQAKRAEMPDGWKREIETKTVRPIPYQALRRVPLLQGKEDFEARRCRFWLEHDRNIPIWTQNMCKLRYMSDSSAVVFPVTDIHGSVFMLRARSRKGKKFFTVKPNHLGFNDMEEFASPKHVGIWFGMYLVDWSRPVMLVEDAIDMMRIVSLGFFNVIASMTSNVTDAQIDALHASTYLLGYDDDKAGKHGHARIIDRIENKATMFELKWGIIKREDGEPCKDGGDLLNADDLNTVLTNRRLVVN